ncbi:cyclin-A1-like [Lepus europaeus]|uniref:cyclin-A1-like n=1 Tax=Lepus europaeus TaxID=9983 RepID=UPI002B47BA0D|nr:cyclin-A1-like [Lepus europaeus]
MRKQPDITEGMRTILVDWLVEVGEEYKLRAETLYLAVNFLDRFLSSMSVLRGKLQLVGTAAILLASKYEEIYPPEVDEFVYITDDTYTKRQLLRMEHLLLKVLAFDLTVPTTNQFLLQYMRHQGVCIRTENLAKYVAELSLLEADPFLKYLPSLIAAAAYCLANYTVNRHFWQNCNLLRRPAVALTPQLSSERSGDGQGMGSSMSIQEQQIWKPQGSLFCVEALANPSLTPSSKSCPFPSI